MIKNHGYKIVVLLLALIIGIILVFVGMKRGEKSKDEKQPKRVETQENPENYVESSSKADEDNLEVSDSKEDLKLNFEENNGLISDDDWLAIKMYCKGYTKKEVLSVLVRFDKLISTLPDKSREFSVQHNFGADLKNFAKSFDKITNTKCPSKVERISLKSVYNIYRNLRRRALILLISSNRHYMYGEIKEIVSMFMKPDIFFKDTLYEGKDEIIQKVMIYVYYIVFFEMNNIIQENQTLFDKHKEICVGSSINLMTILNKIESSLYNLNSFKKIFIDEKPFYLISHKELHSKVLGTDEVIKRGPKEIRDLFMKIKKENPFLNFINRMSVSSNDKILVPHHLIDRIINSFMMFIYPEKK